MEDSDLILGMDWLVKHNATIHSKLHRVSVAKTGQQRWFIPDSRGKLRSEMLLMNRRGSTKYLVVMNVVTTKDEEKSREEVDIV